MTDRGLGEFGRRRADIGEALRRLEDALARPVSDAEAWRHRVGQILDELVEVGRVQIAALLAEGGPLDEAELATPRLAPIIAGLRRDLPAIEVEITRLRADLGDDEPAAIRRRLLPAMGRIVALRQALADVLWEAYSVDIGGPG